MSYKTFHFFGAPLSVLAAGALLFCLGCSHPCRSSYYELMGGDPEVDYLELFGDSLCRYQVPGGIEVITPCQVNPEDGSIVVEISGFVKGYLWRISPDTLVGRAPFFEGVWIRR